MTRRKVKTKTKGLDTDNKSRIYFHLTVDGTNLLLVIFKVSVHA